MTIKFCKKLVPLCAITIIFSACQPAEESVDLNKEIGMLASDQVVAVVNGKELKAGSIQEILDNRLVQKQMEEKRFVTPGEIEQHRRRLIEQLIVEEVIRQATINSTVTVSEAAIDARIEMIAAEYNGITNFMSMLKEKHYTLEEFKADARTDAIAMKMMEAAIGVNTNTVADARKYYEDNIESFCEPAGVVVSHILKSVKPDMTALDQSNIVKTLENLKVNIESGKLSFAEAAIKYSDCPSRDNAGAIGIISVDDQDVLPQFKETALATEVGDISSVFQSEVGSHIIYVSKKFQANTADFDEIKYKLIDMLDHKAKSEMVMEWTQKIRNEASVEYKKLTK